MGASQIFQVKYGERAIDGALAILERNLRRVTDAEEDTEKYALSLSIVNFLKAATNSAHLCKVLKSK